MTISVNQALNLQAGISEIEQQTERQAGSLEIVHALRPVDRVRRVEGFGSTSTAFSTSRSAAYAPPLIAEKQ